MFGDKQTGMLATALFSKRQDGSIAALSAMDAKNLMGRIDSYSTGMGAFNLLIPARAIQKLGLDESLWQQSTKPSHMKDGTAAYDMDYMTGIEFVSRLEVLAGCSWPEAQAFKASIDATRDGTIEKA
jgi:hypothetical protein